MLGQLGNSADKERTLGAKLRGESGAFNWYASGFARDTDAYEIPGFAESARLREIEEMEHEGEEDDHEDEGEEESRGTVENSDSESWGATVGGSYVWDRGFFGVSVGGFGSDYGVPGHAHEKKEMGMKMKSSSMTMKTSTKKKAKRAFESKPNSFVLMYEGESTKYVMP